MGTATVEMFNIDGQTGRCLFEFPEGRPWWLKVLSGSSGFKLFDDPDLFECFPSFRRMIEPFGWRLLCNGARTDTWPSGMSRDWCGGKMLMQLSITNRYHTQADLVDIFAPAPKEKIGTIEQQIAYRDKILGDGP